MKILKNLTLRMNTEKKLNIYVLPAYIVPYPITYIVFRGFLVCLKKTYFYESLSYLKKRMRPMEYLVSRQNRGRVIGRLCSRCKKPIVVGDKIITRCHKNPVYHKECFEGMFV
jgi:hypothetical protein